MMTAKTKPVLHLMRVTIEAVAPLSLGSGDVVAIERPLMEDGKKTTQLALEVALVRDANGLPTIPGATLQGVLNHLFAEVHGRERANELFGHADENDSGGQAGRLVVGFGCVHDSASRAVVGLIDEEQGAAPLLKELR